MKKVSRKLTPKISVIVNEDYLPALLKLLGSARKSIDIISFSFAIGSAAGKLATTGAPFQVARKLVEIKEKKGDKMRIRFFTEGLRETVDRNRVTAEYLAASGIEVRYGSTHAKGFCIDGKIVLFGSTNLTNQSVRKNNEANLLIEDKKLSSEFLRYFEHLWSGGHHGEIHLKGPWLADGDFMDDLIHLIDHAKKTIHFSIYFFNHREIEQALIRAHERGVKVRGFIHQHNSFALPYIWANRSTVKRMKKAGIEELYFGPPTTFSHAKFLVADSLEVSLGTGNWLVEDVLIHPQLFIHLKDRKVAKKLIAFLEWEITSQNQPLVLKSA